MAGGDREKALDAALANIEKQFGKGSVMRLGDDTRAPLEIIPSPNALEETFVQALELSHAGT